MHYLIKVDISANEHAKTFIFVDSKLIYEADGSSPFEMTTAYNLYKRLAETNVFNSKELIVPESISCLLPFNVSAEDLKRIDLIQF